MARVREDLVLDRVLEILEIPAGAEVEIFAATLTPTSRAPFNKEGFQEKQKTKPSPGLYREDGFSGSLEWARVEITGAL